jgi:hypothetical protein
MKKLLNWLTRLCDKVIEKEIRKPMWLGHVKLPIKKESAND